jgi:hypothetical protein
LTLAQKAMNPAAMNLAIRALAAYDVAGAYNQPVLLDALALLSGSYRRTDGGLLHGAIRANAAARVAGWTSNAKQP